jgi:hypothetical protein
MPAHGHCSDHPDTGVDHYRFTVRCDRERNHAIEAAARSAGVSATTFVQQHFETILDAMAAAMAQTDKEVRSIEVSPFDAQLATLNGITAGELRVWRAVKAVEDDHGRAEIGVGAIAKFTGLTDGSVRVLLSRLVRGGHLARISGGGWRRTTIYRVVRLKEPLS